MWLFVPNVSTSSASAPEVEGSTSESSWQSQALAASVWWRGKPSPPRTWSQRCSKVSWLQRLCGAMPEPSTAALGVAQWTASLVASRASLTALPVSASSGKTLATSGQRPAGSSSSPERGSSSSRTSRGCSAAAEPNGFTETWADLVSRVRSDCSQRQKSARAISENAHLSSRWLTPSANEDAAGHPGAKMQQMLTQQAKEWSTPRDSDGEKGGPNQSFGAGGIPLPAQSVMWATPKVLQGGPNSKREERGAGGPDLQEQVISFLPDRLTSTVGGIPSTDRRSLNPLFVEWLMGWPPGWTLLAWTDFACSATALSLWKQRMRSALSQLASPHAAPPAQLALFG